MIRMRINRRTVLGALASVPGIRLLLPTSAWAVESSSPARDVIHELGVRPCINAAGTYTALTGSLMPPEVMAGIQVASIGPVTSATARKLGIQVTVEAARFDESGLIEAILSKGIIEQ